MLHTELTENGSEVSELRCTQEEADSRLLLNARHAASNGHKAVKIVSDDTDVHVIGLCVAFSSKISCDIYLKSGTQALIKNY